MHERTERERKTELYEVLLFCITAVQQSLYNPLKTAYHTVVDEDGQTMFRKQGSSRFLTRSQASRGVPCREAARSMTLLGNRSPLFLLFFFNLTYSRWTSSLPSCLWSQRIFHLSPVHALQFFLSRCKFSSLTTRQPLVEFYLLTFPRFPLRKKEHKSYFGKNRTHDFRTSRCAAYLLDHWGDEP